MASVNVLPRLEQNKTRSCVGGKWARTRGGHGVGVMGHVTCGEDAVRHVGEMGRVGEADRVRLCNAR